MCIVKTIYESLVKNGRDFVVLPSLVRTGGVTMARNRSKRNEKWNNYQRNVAWG